MKRTNIRFITNKEIKLHNKMSKLCLDHDLTMPQLVQALLLDLGDKIERNEGKNKDRTIRTLKEKLFSSGYRDNRFKGE